MKEQSNKKAFSGNVFIFYAFDIGDDIDLDGIEREQLLIRRPYQQPRFFRNFHVPLSVELPHPHQTSTAFSCKLHRFGVVSVIYKIPFTDTLENLCQDITEIDQRYQEQSVNDIHSAYKKIKPFIVKPKFFHLRTNYTVIQVQPEEGIDAKALREKHGHSISSLLRFETKRLSAEQREEIFADAAGYYRNDLVVIDTEAAFISDPDYEELMDLFEFANIQQLELRYFDRILDQKLNSIYESKIPRAPLSAYLPFVNIHRAPTQELGQLRVDISVIAEQLESAIRLTGDPYLADIYETLVEKFDLDTWKDSISKKLDIIQDVRSVYENQINSIREDMMNVLIIILIFIELVVGVLHYLNG